MTTPEGEGAQSGAEGTQSGAGTAVGTQDGTTTNPDNGSSGTVTADPSAEARAETEAVRARMIAADKRAAALDAELKQLRDKDLPEAEKLKRDYEETQKRVEELQVVNNDLALQVAFLGDNTFSWHNPKAALKLLDNAQLEVRPDGTVSGMKDALKALATAHPYLIKQEPATAPATPAGTSPGNNGGSGGGGKGRLDLAKAAARFPAAATRVRRS